MMPLRYSAGPLALVLLTTLGSSAQGQFSIARPKPASIQQVSATTPSRLAALAGERDSKLPQIRVTIRYLMVDDETRGKIYGAMEPDSIVNQSLIPTSARDDRRSTDATSVDPLSLSESLVASTANQFRAPGRVTSSVMHPLQAEAVLKMARESELCEVSDAPAVILIDGKEAEMNDVVQHPMVVDIQAAGEIVSPLVDVFEDGLKLRMKASLAGRSDSAEGVLLSCEVNTSQTLDVKTHQVYGIQSEPVSVQVPIHLVTSAKASARIAPGHTLLIDPHHDRSSNVSRTRGVPVLTKIPYVGRTFKNVSSESVNRWMIILLEPALEIPKPSQETNG